MIVELEFGGVGAVVSFERKHGGDCEPPPAAAAGIGRAEEYGGGGGAGGGAGVQEEGEEARWRRLGRGAAAGRCGHPTPSHR